ncbi:MAG: phosphate ABC transporter permease PstA [Planctomycetota bacterium]|jgi:phosphate transport system permease protein
MVSMGEAMRPKRRRYQINRGFELFCIVTTSLSLLVLGVLLFSIFSTGLKHLDWDFLTSYPSRKPEEAGFRAALVGSLWICTVCAVVAIPLGVGTALYLEEFAPKNKLTAFIQLNISNLAAVPSVVYGLIGLTAFARMWGVIGDNATSEAFAIGTVESWYYFKLPFGFSVLTGGLTLMLVILPVVIISSQESLRAVPRSLKQGAGALGASRWQSVSKIVLPTAVPGIMTGSILAMSRAIGEAAPVLVCGGALFLTFTPENMMDMFSAMPLQIFNWAGRPQAEFQRVASSGIVVLLVVLLSFNAAAVVIRSKFQKQM